MGIGVSSIVEAGFIGAVDIWGYLPAPVEVCLRGSGSLLFLDAANAPRSPVPMPAYGIADMTCGQVHRPGSVVLVPGPAPMPLSVRDQPLEACTVTTTHILNFREEPWGRVLNLLPAWISLSALSRTADWFQVDFIGAVGWISADYVIPEGNCG